MFARFMPTEPPGTETRNLAAATELSVRKEAT